MARNALKIALFLAVASALLLPGACVGKGTRKKVVTLSGAGATFPYPLYSKWAFRYAELTGVRVIYQSIGSGGGIAQIEAGTVDFGASDAPLEKEELDRLGLIQFPMVTGGVVPVVNVKGIGPGRLKLTGSVLARIYMGEIKRWNDPAIVELNGKLELPNESIITVHRADGSGTTWIFSNYLSKASPEWARRMGNAKILAWPCGAGGKGNEGVSAFVQKIEGSIGYVEFAYALQSGMTFTLLKNSSGKFVAPSVKSFSASAAAADWENTPGYRIVLTDQPASEGWPITGVSFILLRRKQKDPVKAKALLGFFDWCYRYGAADASKLEYVPLPPKEVRGVEKYWADNLTSNGKRLWIGRTGEGAE